jgi:uncharacterized membrane protein
MKRILVILVLLVGSAAYSQTFKVSSLIAEQTKNGTISGTIIDTEANNDPLAFVTIEIKDTNISTTSNIDGSYSFDLKPGIYTLVYSFIGYETFEAKNIEVQPNSTATNTQFLNALTPEMPVLISQLK